jgi:hypothetical protein
MEPQSQHLVSSGRQAIAFSGATLHFEAFAATIQALEAIYRASPHFRPDDEEHHVCMEDCRPRLPGR